MPALNKFMLRGPIPPQVHGVLDYPHAGCSTIHTRRC
jgi:hypothetical protein